MIPPDRFSSRRPAGIALILVLSILVLVTAVVVAFFTNSTTDLTSSKGYSSEVQVKLLANSALNVVEGQIRAATAGTSGNNTLAWASQPGLIRTYDNTGATVAAYKLYSSDVLQVAGMFNPNAATTLNEEIPTTATGAAANWNTLPSDFTDLNSPEVIPDPDGNIVDPTTTLKYSARFPIIDGNNLGTFNGALTYLDQNNLPSIAGFSAQAQPTSIYDPTKIIAPDNDPVPLPVRWLYVLQNGELHPRDPTSHNIQDASATNPVIGRIAFWTDDDTCRLNVNTASEGTFWDRPCARNPTEGGLPSAPSGTTNYAVNIPAQNEFQMFTGHPAKTCLSTVLGDSLVAQPASGGTSGSLFAGWQVPGYRNTSNTSIGTGIFVPAFMTTAGYPDLLPYYDLVPRVTRGDMQGSAGGTQQSPTTVNGNPSYGIIYDADRLYDSVDELMFNTAVTSTSGVTNRETRNVSTYVPGGIPIQPQFLETTRFFLTTSNRAPEVTLLNTPRVALWPLQASTAPSYRTSKEQLLAFCSTIPAGSSNQYYFQRYNAAVSGGAPFSCESTTLDWTLVARNPKLYTYLQTLLQTSVPGLGGTFAAKYPNTYNQILTEMVDQIRSGVNTWSTGGGITPPVSYTQPGQASGERQVVPLVPPGTGTQGFGRFPTITEAAIDFFQVNRPTNAAGAPTGAPIQIGAVLYLQPFTPSPGYPPFSPNLQVEVTGLQSFTIQPTGDTQHQVNLGFSTNDGTNIINSVSGDYSNGECSEFNTLATTFYGKVLAPSSYPFFSTPSTAASTATGLVGPGQLPSGTTNFDFNAGASASAQIVVKIYSNPTIAQRTLLQTITIPFPTSLNIPVPTYTVPAGVSNDVPHIFQARNALANDGQPSDPSYGGHAGVGFAIINPGDVVRSMVVNPSGPSKGDYRVIAALQNVNAQFFAPHPFYLSGSGPYPLLDPNPGAKSTNWRFADSLRSGDDPGYGGLGYYTYSSSASPNYLISGTSGVLRKSALTGSLIPLTGAQTKFPYSPEAAPAVPPNLQGAYLIGLNGQQAPGDWDTGTGNLEDGPYINKPDESDGATARSNPLYFSRWLGNNEVGQTYSPNRQIASAVAFGSLPTGIVPSAIDPSGTTVRPWQTLLFNPEPAAQLQHPGFGVSRSGASNASSQVPAPPYRTIPDHYILDLFTMPIVEPYAISEPLSTQGKVNMNYQIAPFTYVRRDTAVQAVLRSTRLTAIPTTAASTYKSSAGSPYQFRYAINPDETNGTLKGFEDRFAPGDMFRSASEICSIPLVPAMDSSQSYDPSIASFTPTYASMPQFWSLNQLTGDNVREEPYGDLYPRLTTKSNSFTVHVRVQTVKKSAGTNQNTFIDPTDTTVSGLKDTIAGEYRGSYQIERYVDPSVTGFPDYVTAGLNATPISTFYKIHTIGTKQF